MYRRSARKRKVPACRQDFVASSVRSKTRITTLPASTVGQTGAIYTHPSTSTGTTSSSFVQTSPVLPASCGQHIHAPPSLETTVGQHDGDALPVVQTSPVPVTIPGQNPPALSLGSISQVQSGNTYCEAPQHVIKASDNLACNVAQSVKQKIVLGEYIDMATLLTNSNANSSDTQKIAFLHGELVVQPKQSQQKITSVEVWTDAFIIYLSIYCSAHPDKFHDLLKYMNTIRLGAKQSTIGWRLYDEQFRLRKAQNPTSSWANIDTELWLLYMHGAMSPVLPTISKVNKCYGFNYNGVCGKQTCHYSHTCMRCFGTHPLKFCHKSNAGGVSNTPYMHQSRPTLMSQPFEQTRVPRPFHRPIRPRLQFMRKP